MNVKYQIFVSSTYEGLQDERNEVIKARLNMGHNVGHSACCLDTDACCSRDGRASESCQPGK